MDDIATVSGQVTQLVRYFLEKWGMARAPGRIIIIAKTARMVPMPIMCQGFVILPSFG